MGGAPIPKWNPIGFEPWPNQESQRVRLDAVEDELRSARSHKMPVALRVPTVFGPNQMGSC